MNATRYGTVWGILAVAACWLPACQAAGTDGILTGAGATFPAPLYTRWCELYFRQNGMRVTYDPVGSGTGISQLYAKTIDWSGSDAFIADEDLPFTPAPLVHIPTCLGAVAIVHNVPNAPEINLTAALLADILRGQITQWSDRRIAAVNPQRHLLDLAITVVHRSDASGTTFILSDYLTKAVPAWRNSLGRGRQLSWPVGLGVGGSDAVATMVGRVSGAIGYTEMTHAQKAGMPCARMQNRQGEFLAPSVESVTAAAQIDLPTDTRVYLGNTHAPHGYPIVGFTWAICYREQNYDQRSRAHARQLAQWLWWMTHDGQRQIGSLSYAPLPDPAVKHAEAILRSLTYNDHPLLEDFP